MTTINQTIQQLDVSSGFVELFILDCTQIGGSIYRFTPNVNADGSNVVWRGDTYALLPIQTTGWQFSGTGQQYKPQLSVSNVNKILLNSVISLGDIVGATLTRIRTFAQFLDNGATPDPSAILPPDVFLVDQKTAHDSTLISWQLSSILDRFGMSLPRRQVLKDYGFPGAGIYQQH